MSGLIETINSLKFKYLLQAGCDATLLLVPKRKTLVQKFAEDLTREVDGVGSPAYVFDCLWHDRRGMSICGLNVQLHNGDDLGVGNPLN